MLTQEERDHLGIQLTKLSIAYGVEFPKEKASAFINSLIEFVPGSFEQYMTALNKYVAEGNTFFPSPIKLQKYVNPLEGPESEGRAIASRIREAVSRYGWSNQAEAKFYIGPVGWKIVESSGGWSYLCENLGTNIDPNSFYAQARDRAIDLTKFGPTNPQIGYEEKPQIVHENKNNHGLVKIRDIFNFKKNDEPGPA